MNKTNNFLVGCPGDDAVKLHVCNSRLVAEAVAKDLHQRFGSSEIKDNVGCLALDYGGAIVAGWETQVIRYENTEIQFWAHHIDLVMGALKKALAAPRAGGYVKLHGTWSCLALSVGMAEAIYKELKDNLSKYKEQEELALTDWSSRMDALRKDPHPNLLVPPKIAPNKAN